MQVIKISKQKLLNKLKENKKEHEKMYDMALGGWREQVVIRLEQALYNATKGIEYETDLDLDPPEEHLADYSEIIDRVEWNEEEVISLDLYEFNHFIRDSWDWMPDFLNTAFHYSSASSSSSSRSVVETISRKMNGLKR